MSTSTSRSESDGPTFQADLPGAYRELAVEFGDVDNLAWNFAILDHADPDLAADYLRNAAVHAQAIDSARPGARIVDLPKDADVLIHELRTEHVGRAVRIRGIVKRTSEVRPELKVAAFDCVRCGATATIPQAMPDEPKLIHPLKCDGPGGCDRTAANTRFTLNFAASVKEDYQYLDVQDLPDVAKRAPGKIHVVARGPLAGMVLPGRQVVIEAIVRPRVRDQSPVLDVYLQLTDVRETGDVEEAAFSKDDVQAFRTFSRSAPLYYVSRAIAPTLFGFDSEKLALALQLFGGVTKTVSDGRRIRGDVHILLCGDPGVAKSELIHYVTRVAPSVYAGAKTASAAGLTASVTKDQTTGAWTLEAGVLVLADGGMAIIDEIEKGQDSDMDALLMGMEQQLITINKAGINATLNSRCAVLAACNPTYGRFSPTKYLWEQIPIKPALLSRFDLVFPVLDSVEQKRDAALADHVLRSYAGDVTPNEAVTPEFVRRYVAYAKAAVAPSLTTEAIATIREYYVRMRQSSGDRMAITPRQLEGLTRLAEASARARLSRSVEKGDVETATGLFSTWLNILGGDIDQVATGIPTTKRNLFLNIERIVRVVADRSVDREAKYDQIVMEASKVGILEADVKETLDALAEKAGVIYRPRKDVYKVA